VHSGTGNSSLLFPLRFTRLDDRRLLREGTIEEERLEVNRSTENKFEDDLANPRVSIQYFTRARGVKDTGTVNTGIP
jgi:hypothetical protein